MEETMTLKDSAFFRPSLLAAFIAVLLILATALTRI
jgi:hypothetical protein